MTRLLAVINTTTATVPILILVIAGSVSLVVRVRNATGTEREQLRWIAASFSVLMAAVVSGYVVATLAYATVGLILAVRPGGGRMGATAQPCWGSPPRPGRCTGT